MKQAAFALKVKTFGSDEQRIISGICTAANPDRLGDVVEPLGVTAAATVPVLLHHDHRLIVGRATLGRPTAAGIPFEAQLARVAEQGALQTRTDEAWQLVKHGLITSVSSERPATPHCAIPIVA